MKTWFKWPRLSAQRARQLLVWMHIITSVGWMSQALSLFALLVFAYISVGQPDAQLSSLRMAELLDRHILVYFGNAAAYTGLMLSALTAWGYFRYWWVLTKFTITVVLLYVAIFVLAPALKAAASGQASSTLPYVVAPLLMATAIAFQAWLSVAKPWKRTPWSSAAAPSIQSARWFGLAMAAPLIDYGMSLVVGFPSPFLQVLVVVGYPFWRRRRKAPAMLSASAAQAT